jgi:hypothetical protein
MWVDNLKQYTGWGDDPLFEEEHLLQAAQQLEEPHWARFGVGKVRSLRPLADEAEDQVNSAVASIEMVADPVVKERAIAVRNALFELIHCAQDFPPRECGGWSTPLVEADERLEAARTAFIKATRQELGVKPVQDES